MVGHAPQRNEDVLLRRPRHLATPCSYLTISVAVIVIVLNARNYLSMKQVTQNTKRRGFVRNVVG